MKDSTALSPHPNLAYDAYPCLANPRRCRLQQEFLTQVARIVAIRGRTDPTKVAAGSAPDFRFVQRSRHCSKKNTGAADYQLRKTWSFYSPPLTETVGGHGGDGGSFTPPPRASNRYGKN